MERLTVQEAAAYIGASVYKTYEMVRLKQIPAYRIGARILFRKVTLDEWIAKQEAESSSTSQGVR
jgi:excisionase family DNA binding protein